MYFVKKFLVSSQQKIPVHLIKLLEFEIELFEINEFENIVAKGGEEILV